MPVVPFALLPIDTARYPSISCTAAVPFALGIGRATIGRRRPHAMPLHTLAVAAAAGAAGVLPGRTFG